MCLILFSYQNHPKYPLILAANRDEFYARPSRAASFWHDAPDVLAGRDLEYGGTWLGVSRQGRFAALTNYRDPLRNRSSATSRGHLTADFLLGNSTPAEYIEGVRLKAAEYNGFNMLLSDGNRLWFYSNQTNQLSPVSPGIHGLSNHLLDSPWPKVERGKALLQQKLTAEVDENELISLLQDDHCPDDSQLPDTGVGLAWERVLAPMFIAADTYGTRAMSVVTFRRDGLVRFVESSRGNSGEWKNSSYQFNMNKRRPVNMFC